MHPFVFTLGFVAGAVFGHIVTQRLAPVIWNAVKGLVAKELAKLFEAQAKKDAPPAPPKA